MSFKINDFIQRKYNLKQSNTKCRYCCIFETSVLSNLSDLSDLDSDWSAVSLFCFIGTIVLVGISAWFLKYKKH